MRRVAVHVRVDGRDLAHQFGREETGGVGSRARGCSLMADLDHALSARAACLKVSRPHFLGVLHREGHGLFLVDVLPCLERRYETFLMQMLRGGDQHRIDVLVLQHAVVIKISLGIGSDGFHGVQTLGVDVGRANQFGIPTPQGLAQDFGPPVAGSDNAKADTVIRAQNVRSGQCARQPGSYFADKMTPGLHGNKLLWNKLWIKLRVGRAKTSIAEV